MKILLTDDSAFMRTIIKAALKDIPNLEFMEAENGDVAVELYRNDTYDVVFLDIIMPVKNGIMAMEEIRQINPAAKVIIVTSVTQDEMVEKAKQLQANAFLPKPFQPQQIRDIFLQVTAVSAPNEVNQAAPVAAAAAPGTPVITPDALSATQVPPAAPTPVAPVPVVAPVAPPPVTEPVITPAPVQQPIIQPVAAPEIQPNPPQVTL